MLQTKDVRWFGRLANERGPLRRVAGLVNKMLLSNLGVKVISSDSFMVTPHWVHQLVYFHRLFKLIESVPGDIVECGVAWGMSLCQLAILVTESTVKRYIWGFDSFEGLPALSKEDLASSKPVYKGGSKGKLVVTEETVLRNLRSSGLDEHFIKEHITLVKGWFSETLPKYRGSSIAFLHLDPDLYESYKTALENLWPKVSVGGIASIDSYQNIEIQPGCRKAVDDYFSQRRDVMLLKDSLQERYYAVKVDEQRH